MSMMRYVEKALHNNEHYDSFNDFYTKEEKTAVLGELTRERDKTADFLHNGARELGVDEVDISYYAGELGRLNRTIVKLESADECPEENKNSKARKALIGFDTFDRF